VVVEGTIRFVRPVRGAVEADLAVDDRERDETHAALAANPKHAWTLTTKALAEDGRVACEADFVYRFRMVGPPPVKD
jgi:hypothetical protein